MPTLRWLELTWSEVRDLADRCWLVIPVGSVEQHGPHLPLGTDAMVPEGIAERLAGLPEWDRPVVIGVPMIVTYAKHSEGFPGTISLDGATLTAYCRDLTAGYLRQGIRRLLFLNGHMESVQFLMEGIDLAVVQAYEAGITPRPKVFLVNWWDLVPDTVINQLFADGWPGWVSEHAGLTETSLMLSFYPQLVRQDDIPEVGVTKPPPFTSFPMRAADVPPSGVYAPAGTSRTAHGEALADVILNRLSELMRSWDNPS